MGNTMYKQGKFNEALDFYKKAIKLTEKKSDVNGDEIKGFQHRMLIQRLLSLTDLTIFPSGLDQIR